MAEQAGLDIMIAVKDQATEAMGKIQGGVMKIGTAAKKATVELKDVTDGLEKAAGRALKLTLAVGGAAVGAVVSYAKIGDAIDKMSKRTGLAAESVSALRVAAESSGTSIESVEMAFKTMQKTIVGLNDSGSKAGEIFKSLGGSVEQLKLLSPERQFEAIGNAIAKIPDPAERTARAMEVFGKSGADLIPMFEDGRFSMDEFTEAAKRMGVSFDEEAAEKAAKLEDDLTELKTTMTGLAITAGKALAPAVTDLVTKMAGAVSAVTQWSDKNPALISGVVKSGIEIGVMVAVTAKLAAVVGTLTTATAGFTVAAAAALLPVVALTAALAALAVGAVAATMAWNEWQKAKAQPKATDAEMIDGVAGAWDNFNKKQEESGRSFRMTAEAFSKLDMKAQLDFIRTYGKGAATIVNDVGTSVSDTTDEMKGMEEMIRRLMAGMNGAGASGGSSGGAKKSAEDMAGALAGLAKSAQAAQEGIADALKGSSKTIADIRKQLSDLDTERATAGMTAKQKLAAAYAKALGEYDALRDSMNLEQDPIKRNEMFGQVQRMQEQFAKFGNVEQSIGPEIMSAQAEARKSDLEKAVDAYNVERTNIESKYALEKSLLEGKLNVELSAQSSLLALRDRNAVVAKDILGTEMLTLETLKSQAEAYESIANSIDRAQSGKLSAKDVAAGNTGQVYNTFNITGTTPKEIVEQIVAALDRRSALTAAGA